MGTYSFLLGDLEKKFYFEVVKMTIFFFYNHFHIVYVLMKHKFELSSKERAFLSPSGNSKVFLIVFTALHFYFTTAVVMHSFEIVFL